MKLDMSTIDTTLDGILDEITDDAREFWSNLTANETIEVRKALKRYAENMLMSIQYPGNQDTYYKGAAHNLNTIANVASTTQIKARIQARVIVNRLFERIIDAGFSAIDLLL